MQKIKAIFICLTAVLSALVSVAQETESGGMKPNDPIVAMLDSLVTLKNVIRYSNITAVNSPDETAPFYSEDIIRERISKIATPIPLTLNKQVKEYINLYAYKRPQLTARVLGLSKLYFPTFEQALDKYNLPIEFKYLSVVESALNPTAVSHCGATGIWQFMFNTGKLYNLNINSYIDERRDVNLATDAACRYFKEMYEVYGDWLLVVASYNCGPGNVNRAIARAGGSKNFWDISRFLPAETRGYVPAFIAVCYVMNYAAEHNISPVAPAFSFYDIDSVGVKNKISLRQLSNSLDIPYDVLSFLNPIYKKGVIPGEGYKLNLPANKVALFVTNEESIHNQSKQELDPYSTVASNTNYREVKKWYIVKKGETLTQFARRTDCSSKEIKRWNKLHSNTIRKGQKLMVYVLQKEKIDNVAENNNAVDTIAKDDSSKAIASTNADSSLLDSSRNVIVSVETNNETISQKGNNNITKYVYHTVQAGDTLWNIAKRYDGVTVETLKEINNLSSKSKIKVGLKLKVPNSNG
jgi:membrane-bound lytic murein transglycosylase D